MKHSRDIVATCARCNVRGLHEYQGTVVEPDGATMREVAHEKCVECGCVRLTQGAERDDLDGESAGWVIERRDPTPAVRPWELPDFVPEPERGTVRPGKCWAA